MSAPLEGPSSPRKKSNPTGIILTVVLCLGAMGCLVLIGLVMAALPRLRQIGNAGRTVACSSNLRSIALGMNLYVADHDDHLPMSSNWMDQVQHYGNFGNRPLRCPEVAKFGRRELYGYAFNKANAGKKLSTLDAKNTPSVFDSTLTTRNAASGLETLPSPGRHQARQLRVNNILFLDGSIQRK